jgi:hypothetical protein
MAESDVAGVSLPGDDETKDDVEDLAENTEISEVSSEAVAVQTDEPTAPAEFEIRSRIRKDSAASVELRTNLGAFVKGEPDKDAVTVVAAVKDVTARRQKVHHGLTA